MMYTEAETFLILKHGSIPLAYKAWQRSTLTEQYDLPKDQYVALMEYEYEMQLNGPGPFEPR